VFQIICISAMFSTQAPELYCCPPCRRDMSVHLVCCQKCRTCLLTVLHTVAENESPDAQSFVAYGTEREELQRFVLEMTRVIRREGTRYWSFLKDRNK